MQLIYKVNLLQISRIISTDEDLSLQIESFELTNRKLCNIKFLPLISECLEDYVFFRFKQIYSQRHVLS